MIIKTVEQKTTRQGGKEFFIVHCSMFIIVPNVQECDARGDAMKY